MTPLPKYSQEELDKALEMLKNGTSIKGTAALTGIPYSTLQQKIKKNDFKIMTLNDKYVKSVLTEEEEFKLYKWIINCAESGHPRTSKQISEEVYQIYLKTPRQNQFPNEKPSRNWMARFLKRCQIRHKCETIKVLLSSNLLNHTMIREYHKRTELYLRKHGWDHVLNSPERVGNADEIVVNLHWTSDPSKLCREPKSNVNVVLTILATGQFLSSYVIFPYERLPGDVKRVCHDNNVMCGKSVNGWLNSETFLEYLKDVLVPHLGATNTERPFILFIDGVNGILSVEIYEFCQLHKLILVTLYPNDTWVLQPLDLGVIDTVNEHWNNFLYGKKLDYFTFAPDFRIFMEANSNWMENCVKAAFEATGVFPWNTENLQFRRMTDVSRFRNNHLHKRIKGDLEARITFVSETTENELNTDLTPEATSSHTNDISFGFHDLLDMHLLEQPDKSTQETIKLKSTTPPSKKKTKRKKVSPNPIDSDAVSSKTRKKMPTGRICRICLRSIKKRVSTCIYLDDRIPVYNETRTYRDAFLVCTGYNVGLNEPREICETCGSELVTAFKVIERCRNTQKEIEGCTEVKNRGFEEVLLGEVKIEEESDEDSDETPDETLMENEKMEVDNDQEESHHNPSLFISCNICKSWCNGCKKLKQHYETTHKNVPKDHTCPNCKENFHSQLFPFHKLRCHKPMLYSCEICEKQFSQLSKLKTHMQKIHTLKQHPCKYCNEAFPTVKYLDDHMNEVHPDMPIEIPCDYCDHIFTSYTSAMKNIHKCKHRCVICSREFKSKHLLNLHSTSHSDKRSCVCEDCGKAFKTKADLAQHRVIHRDPNYECSVCKKAYYRYSILRSHMMKNHPDAKMPPNGTCLNKSHRKMIEEQNRKKIEKLKGIDKYLLAPLLNQGMDDE